MQVRAPFAETLCAGGVIVHRRGHLRRLSQGYFLILNLLQGRSVAGM